MVQSAPHSGLDLDDTGNTSSAGPAPATSSSSRRPILSGSLGRHIPGPYSLAHSSRASHDLIATNDSALDIIAHNTASLLTRTDDVLHAVGQTNEILMQGFERLVLTLSQGGIGLAGPDVDPNSLPLGLRPEPPEVIGQAAHTPISLPPDQSRASYGEGPHSLFDQSARVALAAVMRSPKGHQFDGEASDATDSQMEKLAADRLTPSSSSPPSDLSHSPRTSLLSDDPSAPHSTPNASPEAGAGQQPGVFSADAGASSQGKLPGPSSPMQAGFLPDDGLERSRDGANGGPSNAHRGSFEQDRDSTHIVCRDSLADGLYFGRKLTIRVARKSSLQDLSSQPFAQGIETLVRVCQERRHDLTQLEVEIHQVQVTDGDYKFQDALDAILYALRPHLETFLAVVLSFKKEESAPGAISMQQSRRLIAQYFTRLNHVRVQGETSAARLLAFPLRTLRALEVLSRVTQAEMMTLVQMCSTQLAFLVAGLVDGVTDRDSLSKYAPDPRNQAVDEEHAFVLHIKSDSPCEQLLGLLERDPVVVHFTLTDARGVAKLRDIVVKHSAWTLRLE
ncbi:hypothetical protein FB107DRAFT_274415 [Schizophyllum commune]